MGIYSQARVHRLGVATERIQAAGGGGAAVDAALAAGAALVAVKRPAAPKPAPQPATAKAVEPPPGRPVTVKAAKAARGAARRALTAAKGPEHAEKLRRDREHYARRVGRATKAPPKSTAADARAIREAAIGQRAAVLRAGGMTRTQALRTARAAVEQARLAAKGPEHLEKLRRIREAYARKRAAETAALAAVPELAPTAAPALAA